MRNLGLDYAEISVVDYHSKAHTLCDSGIRAALNMEWEHEKRINSDAFFNYLANLSEIEIINSNEFSGAFRQSKTYNVFQSMLYSLMEQKTEMNRRKIEVINKYLSKVLLDCGYHSTKPTLDRYLRMCSESISETQVPSWDSLFIQMKKAVIEKKHRWLFFFIKNKTVIPNLDSALEYVNSELRKRFLLEAISLLENLEKYFAQNYQEGIEIVLTQGYIEKISVLWSEEYNDLIKRLMTENKKIILFKQFKDIASEVRLENLIEFNKESSGIVIQSPYIGYFIDEEAQMLTERLKIDFQTQFVDLVDENLEDDIALRITRYCLIEEAGQVYTLGQVIDDINTNYHDYDKVDPVYLAAESQNDLLRSRIRSKDTSYKMTNEDLATLLLYGFSLNILRINKKGYSITHNGETINYSSLEDMKSLISYPQEEVIRKLFINRFFADPANVLDRLNSLLNSSSSKKTINNLALSELYKSQARQLASYTKNLINRLTYLREKICVEEI
jgi:hypothetical protein